MRKSIFLLLFGMTLSLTACGAGKDQAKPSQIDSAALEETGPESGAEEGSQTGSASEKETTRLSEEQALNAIKNYFYSNNPELEKMADSDEYTIYWDADTNDSGEIVVLYRSYTGSETRYYIDPDSGETYVTELVPGIINEEQRTDESFNIMDLL